MREYTKLFKALSDETRLKILKFLILEGRHCVLEISDALSLSQTATSRNLAILRDAGFLSDEREGPCTYYYFDFDNINEETKDVLGMLSKWFKAEESIKNLLNQKELINQ